MKKKRRGRNKEEEEEEEKVAFVVSLYSWKPLSYAPFPCIIRPSKSRRKLLRKKSWWSQPNNQLIRRQTSASTTWPPCRPALFISFWRTSELSRHAPANHHHCHSLLTGRQAGIASSWMPFFYHANQIDRSFLDRRDLGSRNLCDGDLFMPTNSFLLSSVSVHKLQQQLWISEHTSLCTAHLWTLVVYAFMHHHNLFF